MIWTTPTDMKAQLRRLWERGELLRGLVDGESRFPLRLALKGPGSAELAEKFEAVRAWIAGLAAIPHVRIEWRELNHRLLGAQQVPESVWVDSLAAAAAWLSRRGEVAGFEGVLEATRTRQPQLTRWLARRPLQAIELAGQWPRLLDVVEWLSRHPRPGMYLRQVDIPGIHSKFIEGHRGVLAELLDLVLPADAVAVEFAGVGEFNARYGFLDKPAHIRFRSLDARLALLPGRKPAKPPDMALDADSFACLELPVRRVFITENETNFLAFPMVKDAIVIFGKGYGWDALAKARWLAYCAIRYWGDIDTHGFAILDALRNRFDHVESFLMDRPTLMAHENLWGEEHDQVRHDLPRLTGVERALFDELRDNRIRRNLRLEQERIGFRWLVEALANNAE